MRHRNLVSLHTTGPSPFSTISPAYQVLKRSCQGSTTFLTIGRMQYGVHACKTTLPNPITCLVHHLLTNVSGTAIASYQWNRGMKACSLKMQEIQVLNPSTRRKNQHTRTNLRSGNQDPQATVCNVTHCPPLQRHMWRNSTSETALSSPATRHVITSPIFTDNQQPGYKRRPAKCTSVSRKSRKDEHPSPVVGFQYTISESRKQKQKSKYSSESVQRVFYHASHIHEGSCQAWAPLLPWTLSRATDPVGESQRLPLYKGSGGCKSRKKWGPGRGF